MMKNNLWKIVVAVCAFLWLGAISASEAEQHKDPFHELVTLTSSEHNDAMSTKALESLLNTLGERIKNLKDCFSLEKLGDLVPPEGDISESDFAKISGILNDFIAARNCSDVSKHLTAKPHVDDIIESLHVIGYESKDGIETCFNAFALRETSENPSQLHATIILYLYEGQCILPDSSYFLTEYQSYFTNENGVASKEVFENLISELGIGGEDAHEHGHDDHEDHNEEHDHENHDDHESDDEHHGHDDHSDDGDDHDDHSTGGHSHDDEHGDVEDGHVGNSTGDHDHDEEHGEVHDHDGDHDGDDHDHGNHSSEIHDHDHDGDGGSNHDQEGLNRTRRDAHEEHDAEHLKERCFSAEQLLDIYEIDGEITEEQAVKLCPVLVQQLKSGACKADEHDDHGSSKPAGYTEAMVYGYGTASVAIISLLALIGFIVFPVLKIKSYKLVMQFFIGLGIGTMAADAIVHIIPHVLGVHDHDAHGGDGHEEEGHEEDMSFIWKMSVVAGGIYVFFFFENCLKLWKRTHTDNSKTNKAHEVYANTPRLRNSSEEIDSENAVAVAVATSETTSEELLEEFEESVTVCCNFTPTLITVFVGDMLHNFADGVAIGVSFTNSWSTGIGASIAIACHELPHEIGDFAIYLKNGASKWQAVGLNFAAACCAFVGLYAGIGMGRDEVVRTWVMAAVAGMFLYIALVQVMNMMVREQTTKPVLQFIMQNMGLVLGWAILLVVALYEDKIQTSVKAK